MELIEFIGNALRVLIHLRYMFAGLLVGSFAGLGFNFVFDVTDRNAAGETLFWAVMVCAVIGLAFDIRRGLER